MLVPAGNRSRSVSQSMGPIYSFHWFILLSPLLTPHFNSSVCLRLKYELVLASLQPHGEHHLLEITNDSELVSPEFAQDSVYNFEAVCPSQLFWEFLYPQRGWSLSSERFYVWITRLHPHDHCRLNQHWTPDSREANLWSCQWSLRFWGKKSN